MTFTAPAALLFAVALLQESVVAPPPRMPLPLGTVVNLSLRNRSESAIMLGGFRPSMPPDKDTVHIAAGAPRAVSFRLDRVGNFFYWGALKGLNTYEDRFWLDSHLTGAFIVDAPGTVVSPQEHIWLITEWFLQPPRVREFESALVFNGKAWPHNERLTFTQNDSVHFRVINAAAVEHPLHLRVLLP